jgi:hypothetical protein
METSCADLWAPGNNFRFKSLCIARGLRVAGCTRHNQCARNLVVRFATARRSFIRQLKRIAWCAAAAARFSEHAANSVKLSQNEQTCKPADARAAECIATLILLPQTPPQLPIGRNECSASGAYHGFVVMQRSWITESKTSAR